VENCSILDLFAGTGALGLEAFSRGASCVVFVDKGYTSLSVLKKNISIFPSKHLQNKEIVIIKDDLLRPAFVKKLPENINPQFDIILADPPYGKDLSLPVLKYICIHKLLKDDGLLVVEERHNIILPYTLANLQLVDRRTYGETGFSFYTHTYTDNNRDCDTTSSSPENMKGADQ